MENENLNKEYVREIIHNNQYAVLATENEGQPHASLISITPDDSYRSLIFATYRNTRKYTNLIQNGKVAILFENRGIKNVNQPDITVLTAFGYAEEVQAYNAEDDLQAHLLRHPELESFLLSKDCAIFRVHVDAYQAVRGIDDVVWFKIENLDSIS